MTGTFDNWTKSEKLDKVGDSFEKTVILPDATQKIYYKVRAAVILSLASVCFSPRGQRRLRAFEKACSRPALFRWSLRRAICTRRGTSLFPVEVLERQNIRIWVAIAIASATQVG